MEMCWLCYDSAVKPSSHRSKVFIFPSRVTVEVVSEVNCDQELELTPEASFHISGRFEILQRITSWAQIDVNLDGFIAL